VERIRIWGLRVIASILLACAALSIGALLETNQVPVRFTRSITQYKGLAAVALPILLIGSSLIALIASSPRLGESKQFRLTVALLVVLGLGMFVIGYATGVGA
jgi:hypothetical protein